MQEMHADVKVDWLQHCVAQLSTLFQSATSAIMYESPSSGSDNCIIVWTKSSTLMSMMWLDVRTIQTSAEAELSRLCTMGG